MIKQDKYKIDDVKKWDFDKIKQEWKYIFTCLIYQIYLKIQIYFNSYDNSI